MALRLAISILLLLAVQAGATINYVGPTNAGAADGSSWANRFTIDSLNTYVAVGDTNKFAPGRHTGVALNPPQNNTATKTYFVCSTWVSEENPGEESNWNETIITGAKLVSGTWTVSSSVYRIAADSSALPVWDDGQQDLTIAAVTWGTTDSLLRPSTSTSLNAGECYYDDTNDTLFVRLQGDANPNSYDVYATRQPALDMRETGTGSDYWDNFYFFGIDFRIGSPGTVMMSTIVTEVEFRHCNLSRSAGAVQNNSGVVHQTNQLGDTWGGYTYYIGCDIGWAKTTATGNGDGAAFSLYGTHHTVIDSCSIHDLQSSAIYFKKSYGTTLDTGSVVKFTDFKRVGRYGVEFYANSYMDSVYGCTFYDVGFPRSWATGNSGAAGIININGQFDNPHGGHLFIANNSFDSTNVPMHVLEADDGDVTDNKFLYNAIGRYYPVGSYASEAMAFRYGNPPAATNSLDSSWYTTSGINYNIWWDGITFLVYTDSVSHWSTWTGLGYGANSSNADPGFTNPGGGDWSRAASGEINVTYGGRTWTVIGEDQGDAASDTTTSTITGSVSINGKVEIQ